MVEFTRKTYYLTAEGCYIKAVQLQIAAEKKEKAKAKKANRKVKR